MPDQPDDRPQSEHSYSSPSSAVQRLAERYGLTPDAIEQIISGTSTASEPQAAAGSLMENAAEHGVTTAAIPPVVQVPPTPRAPVENPRSATRPSKDPKTGPGLPIALTVVVLLALATALSFNHGCFKQRHDDEGYRPNASDTLQRVETEAAQKASEPPITPSPVAPPQVPPEALVVPREAPKGTTGPPSTAGATTMKQAVKESRATATKKPKTVKPVLTTSSYLEAEERLAELHAAGFSKAKLKTSSTGGGKRYSVYSR